MDRGNHKNKVRDVVKYQLKAIRSALTFEEVEKGRANSYDFIKNTFQTDVCGEIDFGLGQPTTSKYVKVSKETDPKDLFELLTKYWKLNIPKLVISITGGAKNLSLEKRVKEVFRESLIKTANKTGAWIVTGGTHSGIMKQVGIAVKQYGAIRDDKNQVVAIGIATWGIVHGRQKLMASEGDSRPIPRLYDAEKSKEGDEAILDCNHSHFILVDDGNENQYGGEISLRTALENHMAKEDANAMIACVLLQGGPGSLETVYRSIEHKNPVVIVGGSGGWADILEIATKVGEPTTITEKWVSATLLKHQMSTEAEITDAGNKITEWTEKLQKCVSNKDLLTIFTFDPSDPSKDLDIAILQALLKAPKFSGKVGEQLQLSMALNRCDIAKSHILSEEKNETIAKEVIANAFFEALKTNKHEFCKAFLEYSVNLKKFFSSEKLKELYLSIIDDQQITVFGEELRNLNSNFELTSIGQLMKKFLASSYVNIYGADSDDMRKREGVSSGFEPIVASQKSRRECELGDPHREIFQWAILSERMDIAKHIWEYMPQPMCAAVMATRMLKNLAKKTKQNEEKRKQLETDAEEYEKLAAGILNSCFSNHQKKATFLLISEHPEWGEVSCLQIALKAKDKNFVSQPAVKALLEKLWIGELQRNYSAARILVTAFFPLLLFTPRRVLLDDTRQKTTEDPENPRDAGKKTIYYTMRSFYRAPIVNFWTYIALFGAYLILFAFVILSNFDIAPAERIVVSWPEYVLVGWTTLFFLEEIREIWEQEPTNPGKKLLSHMKHPWNIMDVISMVFFYVAFGLRFRLRLLYCSLVLYSLTFLLQCVRIVDIFAIHKILGPKIRMVWKMLTDLRLFMFILVVFLLAYGVASQALLYPSERDVREIIFGIIYRPYWMIYGELFLDEINYQPGVSDFQCSDTDNTLPRCPQPGWIVPVLSAAYLLFSNVLLLNLLIAMFSYTFQCAEQQSNEIWTFKRFKLLINYCTRPSLAPPSVVIDYIICILKLVYPEKRNKVGKQEDHQVPKIVEWERWHSDAFTRGRRQGLKSDRGGEKHDISIDNILRTSEDIVSRIKKLEDEIAQLKSGDGK